MIARETGTRTRTKQAEQLLEALHPRGSIFCVAQFHPDDRRQHRYRHPKSPYSGAKLALEWAADDRFIGTYAGVASLRSAPKRGRGTEADVLDVRAVWVEVDACDFGAIAEARAELVAGGMKKKAAKERAWREAPDEARQAALDDAFRALEGAPFEPSILVFSGRGWHAYWLLADPAEGPALALVKACNRAMAERTNGDTVHDLARVLRVPSTWHRKDPANPVRCELYNFEPSYRYTLAELVERLEVDPELAAEEWAGKPRRKASPRGKASDRETIGALPPVPPGWHRYRENSQKADDAWHGRGYSDRSEPAMAIANLAVRSGEAETLDEVLAILDASPACGAWVQEKPRAAIRTAEKALAENPRPKADRRSRPTGGASAAREPLLEVGRRKRPVYADDARGKVCDRAGRTLHLGDTVKCHDGGGKRRRADAGPNIGFIVGLGEDGKATVYFEHEDEDDGKVYANTARLGPADLEYHGKATGAAEAQEAMEPWDDPLPLEDAGLPEMGVRALFRGLPAPLALVEATARAVQMKPCPVAHAVLCAAGMAIAPKFRIVLQGEPRPVAGFGLIVMPSGAGKSPAVGIATGPLAELEDEQRASEEGREKVAAWEAKRDVVEGEIRSIKARLGRKSKSGEENKATLREALEAAYLRRSMLGEHPLPNRFLSDVTSECLGELMAEHGHMNIVGAEGRFLKIISGFYGSKPHFDLTKNAWDGGRVAVARKGKQKTDGVHYVIPNASLAILQAIQPDTLRELAAKRGEEYKAEGLSARFLPCFAPLVDRHTPRPEDDIPGAVIETYRGWLRTLVTLPAPLGNTAHMLRLSAEADRLWREAKGWFFKRPERQTMPDWTTKASDHIGRLAGVLQVMLTPRGQDLTVEGETMARAIQLVKTFYWPHAIELYRVLEQERGHDARQRHGRELLRWLAEEWPARAEKLAVDASKVKPAWIQRYAKRRVPPKAGEIRRLLGELESFGWVRASEKSKAGKPSFYHLHPQLGDFVDGSVDAG